MTKKFQTKTLVDDILICLVILANRRERKKFILCNDIAKLQYVPRLKIISSIITYTKKISKVAQ